MQILGFAYSSIFFSFALIRFLREICVSLCAVEYRFGRELRGVFLFERVLGGSFSLNGKSVPTQLRGNYIFG